jgi:Major Facilitator Superfamily
MTVAASSRLAPGVGRSGGGLALGLICSAQFAVQLDFSIVNVVLPSIQRELGLVASQLQWIVTGYALTFGSLLLLGGRAADLLGRRSLLVAGLALFAIASLGAGLAKSSLVLIVARMVQGVAGAMVSPAALSLLTTMNAEGPARSRALGIWQAGTAAGATTGSCQKPCQIATPRQASIERLRDRDQDEGVRRSSSCACVRPGGVAVTPASAVVPARGGAGGLPGSRMRRAAA